MARISSVSRRSARGVEPMISANMMVTTRRSSGLLSVSGKGRICSACLPVIEDGVIIAGEASSVLAFVGRELPHSIQNFATGGLTVLQCGQTIKRLPHSMQNFAVGGLTVWQCAQRI